MDRSVKFCNHLSNYNSQSITCMLILSDFLVFAMWSSVKNNFNHKSISTRNVEPESIFWKNTENNQIEK